MSSEFPSLPNLNGNPLAVVDVETTGRVGGYHEIVQIAIVPLTLDLEIAPVQPFYHNVRPNFPERAEPRAGGVHGLNLDDLLVNAPTQERVLDYLLEWFSALPLGHRRRLTPIAHNWGFERSFLTPWLGPDLLNSVFHPHPRDTMIFALMLNDRASMMGKELPFHRVGLTDMCRKVGIPLDNAHDALADCVATAKLYASLMRAIVG
jgi:DNA polymerase III epsilon subunit-like protein